MIAVLAKLLLAARLATAIATAHPEVPAERVFPAALAIVVEAGPYEPELLAAIFVVESKMDNRAVNARSGACGLGQVLYSRDRAIQARRCRTVTVDLRAGVRAAVAKLVDAEDFCIGRGAPELGPGLLTCALVGYQAGPAGVRALERGSRRRLAAARAVIARRDRLRAAMGQRPRPAPAIGGSTFDGKHVCLWDDGSLTWALGNCIKGSANPRTPGQIEAALRVGFLVLGEVGVYEADEVTPLVRAARKAVAKNLSALPGDVRDEVAAARARADAAPMPGGWTVLEADHRGVTTLRVWNFPRLSRYSHLKIWHERGLYKVCSRLSGDGTTYAPTGFEGPTLRDAFADVRSSVGDHIPETIGGAA